MSHSGNQVVVDTNLLVSALFVGSAKAKEILRILLSRADPVFSEATFAELEEKSRMAKFDRFTSPGERAAAVDDLRAAGVFIEAAVEVRLCRDPDDDMFLSLAKAAGARMLVSGDNDLLSLRRFEDIPILTPREALEFDWSKT